jgi:hypothetical protein
MTQPEPAGFFPKKDVSLVILDVSVFCNFCAPRDGWVSAFRFFDPAPLVSAFGALDWPLPFLGTTATGISSCWMEPTYLSNSVKLRAKSGKTTAQYAPK